MYMYMCIYVYTSKTKTPRVQKMQGQSEAAVINYIAT